MSRLAPLTSGDLTHGPIIKKLVLFFLPIALGNLFQQFYNAVDAFVVSKYVGTEALAAVGGSPAIITQFVIGFITALAAGCAVVIAQSFGARSDKEVKSGVITSYIFCLVFSAIVGAVCLALADDVLILLKTPAETYDDALLYLKIYFVGTVAMMVFNMGAAILRAVGDSRFPFICLFICCGINIVLDLTFVIVFHLGVAGVAWATVIAQAVSAVLVTVKLLRTKEMYKLDRTAKADMALLGKMMKIGIPSALQSTMYNISNVIIQVGINTLGTVVVASWAMTGKVDGVFWACSNAFGAAITTFIGQNYGAGDIDRVKKGSKKGFVVLFSLSLCIVAALLIGSRFVLTLLTDDKAVIETTWTMLLFFVPFYPVWAVVENYSGVLRGLGDTLIPSVILAVLVCGVRLLWLVTAFRQNPVLENLCLAYPISWCMTAVAIFTYCKIRQKKLLQQKI